MSARTCATIARRRLITSKNPSRLVTSSCATRAFSTSRPARQDADSFAALDAEKGGLPPVKASPNGMIAPLGPAGSGTAGESQIVVSEAEEVDAALDGATDWSRSFSGLSQSAFPKEAAEVLLAPLDPLDVEIKPDGIIYLPEIKYRRILNRAFGPGGWGLAPRSASTVTPRSVSREYALVCLGRLVSVARGEQDYFSGPEGVATAAEGCRSNALMRCCKDLGVASELWDPNYINWWKKTYATMDWVTGATGKKRANWTKKRSAEWKPDFLR